MPNHAGPEFVDNVFLCGISFIPVATLILNVTENDSEDEGEMVNKNDWEDDDKVVEYDEAEREATAKNTFFLTAFKSTT